MTLDAIKEAISELPTPEKATLASWLNEQAREIWTRQMEADFSDAGAGMALISKWDAEIKAGGSLPIEEFLEQLDAR